MREGEEVATMRSMIPIGDRGWHRLVESQPDVAAFYQQLLGREVEIDFRTATLRRGARREELWVTVTLPWGETVEVPTRILQLAGVWFSFEQFSIMFNAAFPAPRTWGRRVVPVTAPL